MARDNRQMEKYIKELLYEYDCVVLPGFGGFITHYVSANIHPITHKFQPPSKRVAFNQQLKTNDSLLQNTIAYVENISREEALLLINGFVDKINAGLINNNVFELKDIGRFFYNSGNSLEFEPENSINYLEDSFSLPKLFYKPIERNYNKNSPSRISKPDRKPMENQVQNSVIKKSNAAMIVVPIMLLLLGGAATFLYFNQDNEQLAGINPFVIFNKKEIKVEKPVVAAPAEVMPEEIAPEPMETIITSQQGRYFVIVGSFKSKDNAFKMKEKFENENVTVSIIEPYTKKKFYRIAIADFETKEAAVNKLDELKSTFGESLWVLSY